MKGESFYDNGHDPPLYRHDVVISNGSATSESNNQCSLKLTIFNSVETVFTINNLFSDMVNRFPCSGFFITDTNIYFISSITVATHTSSTIMGPATGVCLLTKGSDGSINYPPAASSVSFITVIIPNPAIYDKVTKIL